MFSFFLKKSEVILDCFTASANAYSLFPISPARNFIPKWWKDLKTSNTSFNEYVGDLPLRNMKGCAGFSDYFSKGLIMPLWSDVVICTSKDKYSFQFADPESTLVEHESEQRGNSFENYHHIKFISQWNVVSKNNVSFLFSSPFWNNGHNQNYVSNFHILPGVVNFKYQSGTHVNVFVPKNENKFFLTAGMPLVHLYPNSEKNIVIKNHLVTKDEIKKVQKFSGFTFDFGYYKRINLLKSH